MQELTVWGVTTLPGHKNLSQLLSPNQHVSDSDGGTKLRQTGREEEEKLSK